MSEQNKDMFSLILDMLRAEVKHVQSVQEILRTRVGEKTASAYYGEIMGLERAIRIVTEAAEEHTSWLSERGR